MIRQQTIMHSLWDDQGRIRTSDTKSIVTPSIPLLPQLRYGHLLVIVLVEDLGGGQVEVLLCDVHPALTEGVHTGLGANTLQLST